MNVFSELAGCPDGCPCLDMVAQAEAIGGEPMVFVDCSHSEACAMWDERVGGEYSACKDSTRRPSEG